MNSENRYFRSLNLVGLTRKYWREQIFFYFLTTLSCLGSFLVSENGIKGFVSSLNDPKDIYSIKFLGKEKKNFGSNLNFYLFSMSLLIFIYFVVVGLHVWFSFYLQNRVRADLKKVISEKIFRLKFRKDVKRENALLNYNTRVFSESVFYIPNQLYYLFVDVVLNSIFLSRINISDSRLLKFSFFYFTALVFICLILQYIFYKKEFKFHDNLENEMKNELFLIDNRDLIIKKNSVFNFFNNYNLLLDENLDASNDRDFFQTLSFVLPSYFFIKLFPLISIFIAGNPKHPDTIVSLQNLVELLDGFRKFVERSRTYPFYISSQKRIENFLKEEERDDVQRNFVIRDSVDKISLCNVNFSYYASQPPVLKDLNMTFLKGTVNRMNFRNGFGKSTIINLIMGLLIPNSGEILVNDNYHLKNMNLNQWRSKISYSEHKNLVCQENFSTGQKQLVDLASSFDDSKKEIFIFDEADSNLDKENRAAFLEKVEELAKKKLVILVSHLSSDEKFN